MTKPDMGRPSYHSEWLRREALTPEELALLIVGFDPDEAISEELVRLARSGGLDNFIRSQQRSAEGELYDRFGFAFEQVCRSLKAGVLSACYEKSHGLIPRALAAKFSMESGIACDGWAAALAANFPELAPKKLGEPAELSKKERTSAAKIIVGMAIARYKYDPLAAKNNAPSMIVADVSKLGLSIDEDTVRKWLKEGKELL